jgi:SAM-dependent methyltransferase
MMDTWEQAVLWLRDQPGQEDLVKAAFFDDPVSGAAQRYHASCEWGALQDLLPRILGRALEIGAGRGIASYALAKDGWEVTALEPDPSDVVGGGAIRSLVEETGLPILLVNDWGESLPFHENSYDIVLCRQVLHHAINLDLFCKEIHRVLKPGGTLFAIREHVLSKHSDLDAFRQRHPLHHRYGGENAYLLREYLDAIGSAGLTIETILNPFQSEINTYPETLEMTRRRLAKRLHLPTAFVPRLALAWIGARSQTPGRLYSFIARKNLNG